MQPGEWSTFIGREYLADFVARGGSAVKFAVAQTPEDRAVLRTRLREDGERHGYLVAEVDAASTRLHLIDRLFFDVARQVDWDSLAYEFLVRLLREKGLRVPPRREDLRFAALAAINDYPEPLLRAEIKHWIASQVYRDYAMSQEFRLAMIQLCHARLDPAAEPALANAVREWLRGELRLVSALKHALIFQRIGRHNARHLLASLGHWAALTGASGLVLVLDVSRYADAARPAQRGDGLYYSVAATLDCYEVLRQLVDGTDELPHVFVCAITAPEFLVDDRRGVRRYDALYLRVWDEVRDRLRPNPLAALVRISSEPGDLPDSRDSETAMLEGRTA